MAWARSTIPGFLAGELSPLMDGRFDTEQYAFGLALCENFIPYNEGPLVKRPGFAMIRDAAASSTWLTGFRRGITQEYVLEWLELGLRFFTNGARIETAPNVAYQIATPYTAAEAPLVASQQSFDRQYLWHANHPPAALRRDDPVTFAHEVLQLIDGPFADANSDIAITITASATTGAITLTASAPIFSAGHVGSPIRLEARDFGPIPAWEAGMVAVVVGEKAQNDGKVYQAASAGTTGSQQPVHTDGTYSDGLGKNDVNAKGPYGVRWTYIYDRIGIATITGFTDSMNVSATVTRHLADSLVTVPTWRWSLAAFSNAAGWPHIGTIWKGRWIAFKDFDIIGSVVGDYGGGRVNFDTHSQTGELADDLAFRRTLSLDDPPHWVARDRRLFVGTPTREVAIGPTDTSGAVTGSNLSADDQSYYGSEPVFPVQSGTETIFIQRGGRRWRGGDFDFTRDRYDAPDLTAAASHISGPRLGGGFIQLAMQRTPQGLVYAVRADGELVAHPKNKLEIKGFSRIVLGGGARVKSATSIFGADGRNEELWLLVERLAGDGVTTLREIWKQEPWRELSDDHEGSFYVDGGVRIDAAPAQTTFTGLTHLAGQPVAVLAAGGVVPGQAVDLAGVLTLPATSVPQARPFKVIVGLAYTAEAVTLRPELNVNGGSAQGMLRRVVKVMTRLIETLGIKVGVPGGELEEIVERSAANLMDHPIPLASGDFGGEVEAEFDRDGRARWVSDAPLPAIVAAAMVNYDVSTKDV